LVLLFNRWVDGLVEGLPQGISGSVSALGTDYPYMLPIPDRDVIAQKVTKGYNVATIQIEFHPTQPVDDIF